MVLDTCGQGIGCPQRPGGVAGWQVLLRGSSPWLSLPCGQLMEAFLPDHIYLCLGCAVDFRRGKREKKNEGYDDNLGPSAVA